MFNSDLEHILNECIKSPYYNDVIKDIQEEQNLTKKEIWNKIPILTRDIICSKKNEILQENYKYIRRKELEIIKTSGSTGRFIEVYWNKTDYLCSTLSLWRKRLQWYGIGTKNSKVEFSLLVNAGDTRIYNKKTQISNNTLSLSVAHMDEESLNTYYHEMLNFNPDWIYTTPSALLIFIEFCKKRRYEPPKTLKYVELYGEYVSQETYKQIKEFFGVPTAVMYGAKEVNGIALMCPYGHLHILSDNVYVEKENGKNLITSLKNSAFPIIKYDIGDVFDFERKSCKCGINGDVIVSFAGREKFLSYVDSEKGITIKAITNVVYAANALFRYCFLQYQIILDHGIFEIVIVLPDSQMSWSKSIEKEIKSLILSSIGSIPVKISITQRLLQLNEATGKANSYIFQT